MSNLPQDEQLNDELLDPRKGLFNWCIRLLKGLIHSEKKIGDMNGKWAALFRIVLVLVFLGIPALGTWTVWMTKGIWNSQRHIETTIEFENRIDLLEQNAVILERVDKAVSNISKEMREHNDGHPPDIQDRVDKNTDAVKDVKDSVIQLDKTNTEQHNKIYKELGDKVNQIERENSTDHASMKTTLEFIKEKVSK